MSNLWVDASVPKFSIRRISIPGDKDNAYFVAWAGLMPVASVTIKHYAGIGHVIDGAYVQPEWQRQGIATALLAEAREIYPDAMWSNQLSAAGNAWAERDGGPRMPGAFIITENPV